MVCFVIFVGKKRSCVVTVKFAYPKSLGIVVHVQGKLLHGIKSVHSRGAWVAQAAKQSALNDLAVS